MSANANANANASADADADADASADADADADANQCQRHRQRQTKTQQVISTPLTTSEHWSCACCFCKMCAAVVVGMARCYVTEARA
jgi:hypothetical protein